MLKSLPPCGLRLPPRGGTTGGPAKPDPRRSLGYSASCAFGVTLIELMVTLTLLAFLMLAVMPSVTTWMRNSQVRTAAQALLNGLAKARTEAIRRNGTVQFSLVSANDDGTMKGTCALSSTSGSWVVSLQDPAGHCTDAASENSAPMIIDKWAQSESAAQVTVAAMQPSGANACGAPDSATRVAFNGFGRVDASAAAPLRCLLIDHASGGDVRKLQIVIGSGGIVRMCDPAVIDANDPRKC